MGRGKADKFIQMNLQDLHDLFGEAWFGIQGTASFPGPKPSILIQLGSTFGGG